MANPHLAVTGEYVTIKPDEPAGGWTVTLPPNANQSTVNNNDFVGIKGDDFGVNPVTINITQGTATISDPALGAATQEVNRVFVGDSILLRYNAGQNQWKVYESQSIATHSAILAGVPSDNTPGGPTAASPIVGWDTAYNTEFFAPPSAAAGTITIPKDGLYNLQALVMALQGNSNKELSIVLRLERSTNGDLELSVFDIATDKTTLRSFNVSAPVFGSAGETWRLSIWWVGDSSPGTMAFATSGWQVIRMYN